MMTLLSKRIIIASVCVLGGPTVLYAQQGPSADHARLEREPDAAFASSLQPYFSGSFVAGALPAPYASKCGSKQGYSVIGFDIGAGVRIDEQWDFRLRTSVMRAFPPQTCALVPIIPTNVVVLIIPTKPDGIYQVRKYADERVGDGIRTVGLEAGYSPALLPVMRVSAGAGFDWMRWTPYVGGGVGFRVGSGQFRIVLGGQLILLRTPYRLVEEEWADRGLLRSELIGREHEWDGGFVVRLGGEYTPDGFD